MAVSSKQASALRPSAKYRTRRLAGGLSTLGLWDSIPCNSGDVK